MRWVSVVVVGNGGTGGRGGGVPGGGAFSLLVFCED